MGKPSGGLRFQFGARIARSGCHMRLLLPKDGLSETCVTSVTFPVSAGTSKFENKVEAGLLHKIGGCLAPRRHKFPHLTFGINPNSPLRRITRCEFCVQHSVNRASQPFPPPRKLQPRPRAAPRQAATRRRPASPRPRQAARKPLAKTQTSSTSTAPTSKESHAALRDWRSASAAKIIAGRPYRNCKRDLLTRKIVPQATLPPITDKIIAHAATVRCQKIALPHSGAPVPYV